MQRRTRPGRRKSSPLRWLGWLMGLIIAGAFVVTLLAPSLVTGFIRSYLLREEFRQKAEEMISNLTGGETHIESLKWNDDSATISEFRLEDAQGWDIDAIGLHAALDFGAIRSGTWNIQNAGADELTLRRSAAPLRNVAASRASSVNDAGSLDAIPSFLRRHIPTKTKIGGFVVQSFFFEQGGWKINGASLNAGGWSDGQASVPMKLSGGTLETPLQPGHLKEPVKLDLSQATLRASAGQLLLTDATLRWNASSEATLRGNVKFGNGQWQLFTHVQAVPLEEFLDPWWQQRLSGKVKGDCDLSGSPGSALVWRADVSLENGVLQGLPLLDTLASYTHMERFKRLVLDLCQARLKPQGADSLLVEDIIVQSNGLLRIEGRMTLRGQVMEGDFMVGVTPETLRSIPGADRRVFTQTNPHGPPGLLWTQVRVAGPVDAPQEDLSARLIGSAGMSLLFDSPGSVVGRGAEALLKPVLGEDAAKMPGKVIDEASGVLENGVKAGAGLLNKVLPIFPGK